MTIAHHAALSVREARRADLPAIVALLADDFLGRQREQSAGPVHENYEAAFRAIDDDPNNQLLVGVMAGAVVATLQLTFTPSLSYQGSWRATIESVRTASALRGRGIGAALMAAAIERARERGCALVQLSTNKARSDARRFYERLGFVATHEGMKLRLQ
jgi:ribosomal protein S18 acetylase RimI-like enzyme